MQSQTLLINSLLELLRQEIQKFSFRLQFPHVYEQPNEIELINKKINIYFIFIYKIIH
jgi:hypothetical protein